MYWLKQGAKVFLLVSGLSLCSWSDQVNSTNASKVENSPIVQEANSVLLKVSSSSLPNFINKSLKLLEKVCPEVSSMISLAATGFLGGAQCEGVDDKSPCHLLILKQQNDFCPVFFFKAVDECPLVKNLNLGLGSKTYKLVHPLPFDGKRPTWWIYGDNRCLDLICKNLKKMASFIYEDLTNISDFVCFEFSVDALEIFKPIVPRIVNLVYEAWFKNNFERWIYVLNFDDNEVVCQIDSILKASSPMMSCLKSIASKSSLRRCLNWNSEEMIKNIGFQDYDALKSLWEMLLKNLDESAWKQDVCTCVVYEWLQIISPLVVELLNFSDQNLSGNFQTYADLHSDSIFFVTKGFGLFEGKSLTETSEKNLSKNFICFLEKFVQICKQQINLAVSKKLFGSEYFSNVICHWDKDAVLHNNCSIQWISLGWGDGESKIQYPILLSVCKNYLLYADNLVDMKRLIDRMQDLKTFTYLTFPDFISKTTVRLRDVFDMCGLKINQPGYLESMYCVDGTKNQCRFITKIPLCIDLKALNSCLEFLISGLQTNVNKKNNSVPVNDKNNEKSAR